VKDLRAEDRDVVSANGWLSHRCTSAAGAACQLLAVCVGSISPTRNVAAFAAANQQRAATPPPAQGDALPPSVEHIYALTRANNSSPLLDEWLWLWLSGAWWCLFIRVYL
jgi:hypothetical protein